MDLPKVLEAGTSSFKLAALSFLRFKRFDLAMSATVALDIGKSVAMFSFLDAVLLRLLTYPDQESIHAIWKADPLARPRVEGFAYREVANRQESTPRFEYVAVTASTPYGNVRVSSLELAIPCNSKHYSNRRISQQGGNPTIDRRNRIVARNARQSQNSA